jgi:probable DNA repair protein
MPLDNLDRHTTLITVNRRLSRVLRSEFDRARLAAGEVVWESPDMLPYSAWIQRCWNDFVARADGPVPTLLSADQDLCLWETIISEYPLPDGQPSLLHAADTARNARAAWALLREWRLDPGRDAGYASEEVRAFRTWARSYASICRRGDWVDSASIAERLTREGLEAVPAAGVRRVLLAGFDAPTPQQQRVLEALARLGVQVEHWQAPLHDATPYRVDFASQDDELEAAARWARACLEDGARGPIGIVVPGLAAARHRVAAIFDDVFAPGASRPAAEAPARAFNISLGEPLTEVPVMSDALVCLRAMGGRLSLRDAGRWLLSAYLGGGDLSVRARLDAELRRIGEPHYTLARLRELAARLDADFSGAGGGALTALIDDLRTRGAHGGRRAALTEWAAEFSSWLAHAGWPGDRTLTSDEFQAVQACRELLGALAALTPVIPRVDFAQALSQLERLAARQVFQPRSGSAPVQILGILEAVGLDYSHLWLSGLHDQAWPEPARPNPFLPLGLQRELGMPRAGSEQQLAWARRWTTRMLASAGQVVVSHPRRRGDEALRASALIAHLAPHGPDALAVSGVPGDVARVHEAVPTLEVLDDQRAPAVEAGKAVRGGVSVFKDQAACPFRAFAVHRLGAADVVAPDSSLDPRVRGNLVHRLLELIWQTLGAQSRLLAMTDAERAELIRSTVARVLAEEARQRPDTLRGRLLQVEHERLALLADAWLAIEAGRTSFQVQAERSEATHVAGLPVTLRPDRIDRLADGGIFLVDYKTGHCEPRDWFGERPDEPQLPVYALAMDESGDARVVGLAFGALRPGELGYRGLGAADDLAPGVDSIEKSKLQGVREAADWEAHKKLWRARLTRLAEAYLEGDARVDPKSPGSTCRYCRLQPLCRVNER